MNQKITAQQKVKISILLVEDSAIAQQVGKTVLAELDYEVDIASSGKEAVKRAGEKQYDLILMDLGLPDQTGQQVTREIRKEKTGASFQAPIVGLTAHINEEGKMACIEDGMQGVLFKPLKVSVDKLLKAFLTNTKKSSHHA